MTEAEQPQIYLITPSEFSPETFGADLSGLLDAAEVACIRVALSSTDADHVARCCDLVRDVAHDRDIPVVVADHAGLIERLGLDGVHLTDGARSVRKLRKDLGADPIIGAYCGASRHDGMNAGDAGADYVSFGPASVSGLGHSTPAEPDLFAWWSEMIEVPVVAEGGLTPELARVLAPVADFLALGPEIWTAPDPAKALGIYSSAIR